MTTGSVPSTSDLRCHVQTAQLGEPLAGSAGHARRVVLVELPAPWPAKIDRHELLAGVELPHDVKVLAIRPDGLNEDSSQHRIVVWERTEPFRGFERTETTADAAQLSATVSTLATDGPGTVADPVEPGNHIQDLLLCAHGTRDRCCGRLGTILHMELATRTQLGPPMTPEVRIWRTSHTGGHRFAPTGIHFPSGTTWGGLTAETTLAILERSRPTGELASQFRGNLGVEGRPAQIAEGQIFLDHGWEFLDRGRVVAVSDGVGPPPRTAGSASSPVTVTVTVTDTEESHEVDLAAEAPIPVPPCGDPIELAEKATPQYRITEVRNPRSGPETRQN